MILMFTRYYCKRVTDSETQRKGLFFRVLGIRTHTHTK